MKYRIAFLTVFLAVPMIALADCGSGDKNCLLNPTGFDSITKLIAGVLRVIVIIALPIISLFIVYAGFLYVTARGNSTNITAAHKNFYYVIIGAILILGAWVLATLIGGTVSQILG